MSKVRWHEHYEMPSSIADVLATSQQDLLGLLEGAMLRTIHVKMSPETEIPQAGAYDGALPKYHKWGTLLLDCPVWAKGLKFSIMLNIRTNKLTRHNMRTPNPSRPEPSSFTTSFPTDTVYHTMTNQTRARSSTQSARI